MDKYKNMFAFGGKQGKGIRENNLFPLQLFHLLIGLFPQTQRVDQIRKTRINLKLIAENEKLWPILFRLLLVFSSVSGWWFSFLYSYNNKQKIFCEFQFAMNQDCQRNISTAAEGESKTRTILGGFDITMNEKLKF